MRSARRAWISGLVLPALLLAQPVLAQGQIIIVNANAPGVGFNDPTPAVPVGGNTGTTLGEQRIQVFETAASIWEATLKPKVDIFVIARFTALAPNVLGSAGPTFVFRDFPGAEYPGTWYHSALADQLAGEDLNPGFADISANFSSTFPFYLGLDDNEPPGTNDLLAVLLHELGHGLGFSSFDSATTGAQLAGFPGIWSHYLIDVSTNKTWVEMTDAERAASAIRVRKLSWSGVNVNNSTRKVLDRGEPILSISSPTGLGPFPIGTASFGAPIEGRGIRGQIVVGTDGADATGPSPTDGCSPLTNGAAVAGKIALLDRGSCTFVVKVKNAQNAGAAAVIIADNQPGDPPAGLGGADPTITITSVRVTKVTGDAIKASLAAGPVNGRLELDRSVRAGTDRVLGLMMMQAFNPVVPGSSVSHYEAVAFPNQLMEFAINPDLTSSVTPPKDLTAPLMTDIGWFSDGDGVPDGRDACIGSPSTATVEIESCVSTAPNTVFFNGCRIADLVNDCRGRNGRLGERFVDCVEDVAEVLKKARLLTKSQARSLERCAESAARATCRHGGHSGDD